MFEACRVTGRPILNWENLQQMNGQVCYVSECNCFNSQSTGETTSEERFTLLYLNSPRCLGKGIKDEVRRSLNKFFKSTYCKKKSNKVY